MRIRRTILSTVVVLTAAATSAACASQGKGLPSSGPAAAAPSTAAGTSAPSGPAPTGQPAGSAAATAQPVSSTKAAQPASSAPRATATVKAGDPNATSDSYAWKHPCDPGQVSMKVTENAPGSHDGVRIIAVTNTGGTSCGLAYYPSVVISDSTSVGPNSYPTRFVRPTPPGGLGGQPYVPIYAGQTQYAAVSLNPGHTANASKAYDELDIQASDFMPHAATQNFSAKDTPDKADPGVHDPIVTLYYPTAAVAMRMLTVR